MPITHAFVSALADPTALAAGQVEMTRWNEEHDLSGLVAADITDLGDLATVTPGTGIATALAVNVGTDGAPVIKGGALGTPSSGTLTNATGLPEAGLTLADNTTNNASTTKHGFLKKLSNVSTEFMNGQGNWATPAGGATPGGSDTQVQFNDGGSFGGDSGLTYNKTTDALTIGGQAIVNSSGWSGSGAPALKIAGLNMSVGNSGNNMYLELPAATSSFWLGQWGSGTTPIVLNVGSASTPYLGFVNSGIGQTSTAGRASIHDGSTVTTLRDLTMRSLLATGSIATGAVAKSADYTHTVNDGAVEYDATGGARTATLYAASGNAGKIAIVKKIDSSGNTVTVDGNASETIDGATTKVLSSQYSTWIGQVNAAGTGWNTLAVI